MESRNSVSRSIASSRVVAQRWNRGSAAVGLGAALQVDHPDAEQPVADHRAGRAAGSTTTSLPGAGGPPTTSRRLPRTFEQRVAVLVVPDIQRREVDLGGGLRDGGGVETVRNGLRRSTITASTAGRRRVMATRDAAARRPGRGCARSRSGGPGRGPSARGGCRSRGDRPDPQHTRARGVAGAAVFPGQLTVVERGSAAAAVDAINAASRCGSAGRPSGRRTGGGPIPPAPPQPRQGLPRGRAQCGRQRLRARAGGRRSAGGGTARRVPEFAARSGGSAPRRVGRRQGGCFFVRVTIVSPHLQVVSVV